MSEYDRQSSERYEQSPRESRALTTDTLVEAFLEAGLPSDDIYWLSEVLTSGLPGELTWDKIKTLQSVCFDDFSDVDREVRPLITEACRLLQEAYTSDLQMTLSELNGVIQGRPGLFIADGLDGEVIHSIVAQHDSQKPAALLIKTETGMIDGVIERVFIDESKLTIAEQSAIAAYRSTYEI